jgi:hypothetical protein
VKWQTEKQGELSALSQLGHGRGCAPPAPGGKARGTEKGEKRFMPVSKPKRAIFKNLRKETALKKTRMKGDKTTGTTAWGNLPKGILTP